jgi:hypothetical protein
MLGEVMDIVSGIDQFAFVSIYIADARLRGDYSFKSSLGYVGFTRHLSTPIRLGGIEIFLIPSSIFRI